MKQIRQSIAVIILFFTLTTTSISQIDKVVQQAFEEKELNPSLFFDAKQSAIGLKIPIKIIFEDQTFLEVMRLKNGEVQYCLIKNFAHPLEGAELLTFAQVSTRFDLGKAILIYSVDSTPKEPTNNYPNGRTPEKLFLVPDWTSDRVMAFDYQTGNILNENFIPTNNPNLQSPKEARLSLAGFISVSDQISDLVQKYDTSGAYLGIYAPAGGPNPAYLDNIRGHNYRPNNGNLIVAVASSTNANAVAEFDVTGAYLSNFIAVGAGGLNSPFGIEFRANDVLVTGSSSDAVHRYDLNGNYLDNFASSIQFPQQVVELPNGNVMVAVFSVPSGFAIYSPTGVQLSFWTQVTGNRGVARLGNGNYLTTNGGGIHELDTLGNLVRTINAGTNMQYINLIDFSEVIPVELSSFTAKIINDVVELNWTTSSEKNNSGFEIQRATANNSWERIAFITGNGTSTEINKYSFNDNLNDLRSSYGNENVRIKYRLKQVDYDGSFNYSKEVEVDLSPIPSEFALNQNYPNPFNPSTVISYELSSESYVTLKVFDLLGREVATLINNEFKTAGKHEVEFNINNKAAAINQQISSGIFFYSLTAGNFSATKKLLLMK